MPLSRYRYKLRCEPVLHTYYLHVRTSLRICGVMTPPVFVNQSGPLTLFTRHTSYCRRGLSTSNRNWPHAMHSCFKNEGKKWKAHEDAGDKRRAKCPGVSTVACTRQTQAALLFPTSRRTSGFRRSTISRSHDLVSSAKDLRRSLDMLHPQASCPYAAIFVQRLNIVVGR